MEDTTKNLGNAANEAPETKSDMRRNAKLFKQSLYVAGAFVVILIAVLTFRYFGDRNAIKEAAKADLMRMEATDSTSQAAAMAATKKVADAGSYRANQRMQILVANDAYNKGDYKTALEYLSKPDLKSIIITTGIYCHKGDAYVNLGEYDKAEAEFAEALAEAEGNQILTPYVLQKQANMYRAKGDKAKEAEALKRLQSEYPDYNPGIESLLAAVDAN